MAHTPHRALQADLLDIAWFVRPHGQEDRCSGDLGAAEMRALATAAREEAVTIQDIADALGVTRSGATRVVDRLGYQPVNMGVHGALGATFMINEVKPHLREGDVVVLCFEDPLLAYHDTSVELQFMIEHRPDGFALLEWELPNACRA